MNLSFSLGALLVLMAATVAAQDYAIKLALPLKVGQRYQFTAAGNQSSENSMTAEQRVVRNQKEELSLEMESEVTVLALDAKGRSTKESHTIKKLLQGPGKQPLLVAGTKVVASRPGAKLTFEIAGEPVAGDVAKALELALSITSGGPTDDEIFGTRQRKKVGDRWPMNETLALQDGNAKLAGSGLAIAKIKGATTLQKVTKDGAVDVLHLAADLTATLAPAAQGPFTSVDATMTATFTGAFPTDLTKSIQEEGQTMTMVIKASGKPNPEGPVVQVASIMKRSISRQWKLLD
jgi:hypothetical protein